jgi:hypothetical protein
MTQQATYDDWVIRFGRSYYSVMQRAAKHLARFVIDV